MAVWGYGLLGPVEAHVNDRVIPLAGARQRLVLALLLLHANQLVPADRLIDELWGTDLPQDPPGALRTQVSRLRRVLGPAGHGLVTDGGGYRLSLGRAQLDVARFTDALAAATQTTATRHFGWLTRHLGCGAARPWPSSPTGRSPSPKPSGSTNSGWWRGNGGPSSCCRWGRRAMLSPPCR